MPEEYFSYGDKLKNVVYHNENELPKNVKLFLSELRNSHFGNNLKLYRFQETFDTEAGEGESEYENDLDLEYPMDAEKYATGGYEWFNKYTTKFDILANTLGIDEFYISHPFVNKKEFAEKFLKDLKKYMKASEYGGDIHAIKFDLKNKHNFELQVILKRHAWRSHNNIRVFAKDYLTQKGYKKINIHVP